MTETASLQTKRWELYGLLADPVRLRLLRLVAEEELAIGELVELVEESQSKISRQLKRLRENGLVAERRQGSHIYCRIAEGVGADGVIADALRAGEDLCQADGSLDRVGGVVAGRDAASREFFERHPEDLAGEWPPQMAAYLAAVAPLLRAGRLAVDAGTGGGELLEVLAPLYDRVVAVDRAAPRLDQARSRVAKRGYRHVELIQAEFHEPKVRERLDRLGGADAVFATRVLHHAPKPVGALRALAALAAPGGAVVVLDYVAHQDERLRDQQADYWLGFDEEQLRAYARQAGLVRAVTNRIPAQRCGAGPDGHLDWQVLVAYTPDENRASGVGDKDGNADS